MMMPLKRFQLLRTLYRVSHIGEESSSYLINSSCRSYSNAVSNGSECSFRRFNSQLYKGHIGFSLASVKTMTLQSTMAAELSVFMNDRRAVSTKVKAYPGSRTTPVKPMILVSSPGFIYEPYQPRQKIPLWERFFTKRGWKKTKDEIILELKSAYAIAKLRKKGYSKSLFYNEAANMYKEVNTHIANGDQRLLRKLVTENMFSALKNEIKQRQAVWSKVYWKMVEPVVSIRTMRARLIAIDPKDLEKSFIQLTLEIMTKQKFEAYGSKGAVVAGDKNKEVLVRDLWVFEKSMFQKDASWRVCGRILTKPS